VKEAGFAIDAGGRSVTALEIESGILRESLDQRVRCFIYMRGPLPYGAMCEAAGRYSDAHAHDPGAAARVEALEALKHRLVDDPDVLPRIRCYRAGWNGRQVVDLEAFGEQVFQDMWGELDAE